MDITQIVRQASPIGYPPVARGYIASAPSSFSEGVRVVLPGGSTERLYGPCPLAAIHGAMMPAAGAVCVVAFDEQNQPTVVWWEGAGANVLEHGIRADGADNTSTWLALVAKLPATGGEVFFPPGKYVGSFVVEGKANLTIRGAGSSSVLLNKTAGVDALKCVNCPGIVIDGIRVQGANAATRDGLHLEECQRARVRVDCGGTGRAMMWAQKCVGIIVDATSLSVFSGPYPGEIGFPQSGLVLTWDGSDVTSGCNQFVIVGGEYVVGQTPQSSVNTAQYMPGWAIQVIRCEGGVMDAPIAELSSGGIFMQFCVDTVINGYYGEFNPGGRPYMGGKIAVTKESTAVVGMGMEWNNKAAPPEEANGAPGRYLVAPIGAGMAFAKVATLTDNTHLTLAAENELLQKGWSGASSGSEGYLLTDVDLFLDQCSRITVNGGKGGGAVLCRGAAQCILNLNCEAVYLDSASTLNRGRIVTNRESGEEETNRIIDLGVNNLFEDFNYQLGVAILERPLPSYTTVQRNALPTQRPGTQIYVSDGGAGKVFQGWNGTEWVALG